MCSHYQAVTALERFERHFRTALPSGVAVSDMWPTYPAPVVINQSGERQSILARWGLIASTTRPNQFTSNNGKSNDGKLFSTKLSTFNARSESVATSPTFGGAWAKGQRCIIPAEAVYEPDWRSGRHVPTRLQRADGQPLGIAGLWDSWAAPDGSAVLSFTMLTINAAAHPLMQHLHKPQDEKRMVVILQVGDYDEWLNAAPSANAANAANAAKLLQSFPADKLVAVSEPSQAIQDNPGLF